LFSFHDALLCRKFVVDNTAQQGVFIFIINQVSDTKNDKYNIILDRWKKTRYWAIWLNQELLAVVLYKKGAMAIKKAILTIQQRHAG
jgi:hypothetical protein